MSTISASTTSTTAYKVTADTTGTLVLQTGATPTTAVTIDSSQNVGVGNASPAYKLDVGGTGDTASRVATSGTTNSASLILQNGSGTTSYKYSYARFINNDTNGQDWRIGTYGTDNFYFYNAKVSNTFMVLDTSGNLGLGAQATPTGNYVFETGIGVTSGVSADNFFGANIGTLNCGKSGGNYPYVGYNMRFTKTTDSYKYNATDYASSIKFQSGGIYTQTAVSGTAGAAITWIGGPYVVQGGTSWTNASDENLKNITGMITGALASVAQLRAARFTWKADAENKPQVGLIAQDVLAVLPEAVVLPAEPTEKEPQQGYLGVNYTEVVPLLVAAIQELKAELDAAKADIETLKGAA